MLTVHALLSRGDDFAYAPFRLLQDLSLHLVFKFQSSLLVLGPGFQRSTPSPNFKARYIGRDRV